MMTRYDPSDPHGEQISPPGNSVEDTDHRLIPDPTALILDSLPMGIIILDARGTIAYHNAPALILHGGAPAETGRDALDRAIEACLFSDPQGVPISPSEEPLKRLRRGECFADLELLVRNPRSGRAAILKYTAVSRCDTANRRRLAALVFRERDADPGCGEALRSEQRLNTFAALMSEGLVVSENETIVDCNPQFVQMTGYDPLELAGMPSSALIAPEDRDRIAGLVRQGVEAVTENDLIRKDGSRTTVEVRSKTVHEGPRAFRCSVFRDIGERKQNESALKDSHALLERKIQERTLQLQGTIETLKTEMQERRAAQHQLRRLSRVFMDATDPIIIEDLAGTIVEINREAEKAYGWRRDELIGKPITVLIPAELWPAAEMLRQRCRNGEEVHQVEWTRLSRDGERNSVLLTVFLLMDEIGRSHEIASIAKDVTVRKRMESALRRSQLELVEMSRKSIEALEADRRAVARELHDSVGGSLAAVKFMLEEIRAHLDDQCAPAGTLVNKTIAHLAETIKETKRISAQLRPLTLDDLGLLATIEWHVRQFTERHPQIELLRQIAVSEDAIPDAHKIVIYRVLQEALTNAAKHSGADTVRIELGAKGPFLLFQVEDNGCGFDPQSLADRNDPLEGYGLQSMRERVELCGGTFVLDSYPGQGTLVRAMLPR